MNLFKSLLAGLVLALCLFGTAFAGPLEDARVAYDRGDYAAELALVRPLAVEGDAVAQSRLGSMYRSGRGVPQDYAQAVAWYRKAADQGNAAGQGNLGTMYAYGLSVPQDYVEAAGWFRKAADQGDAVAQGDLGFAYQEGQGVPQDYVQAAAWYRKAADQGLAYAQGRLGYLYRQGQGVPQDYVQAAAWYRKAADQGEPYSQTDLGFIYLNGQGVPQDYVEAAGWFRKAADQGDAYAQGALGAMYSDGKGVPQDYAQAYKWLSLAAARMAPGADRDNAVTARDWVASKLDATVLAQAQREASSWTPTVVAPPSNSAGVTEGGASVSPGLFVIVALLVVAFIWMFAASRREKAENPPTADSYTKAFTPEAEAAPEPPAETAAPVQKATPEAVSTSAISPPLPAEPPSADADLTPRPWVRFGAKTLDLFCVSFLFGFLAKIVFPGQHFIVVAFVSLFVWALVEPLVLFTFQTTPGRALFRTQLVYQNGQPIPLGAAYERTIRVYIKGMGLGLPIIYLFTHFVAYRHLTTHGTTTWDQQGGFEVRHGKLSGLRITFIVLIFLTMAVLYVVAVQMQRDASTF
jgi:TPR repeat protein